MYKNLKIFLIVLILGAIVFISCKKNKAPDIPSTPSGPTTGSINYEYTFTSSAEDPNGNSIALRFDWGDSDTSDWSQWKASGDSVSMTHSWSDYGFYSIKAQAKDINNLISEWSEEHQIVISVGWYRTFGGIDHDNGYSVQQTTDGGYIIVGYTFSSANLNDVYLIKVDGGGNEQWSKTFGGSSGDYGYSLQQTSDDGYIIVGTTNSFGAGLSDVYLIKTDANGNQQWYKTFGGSDKDYGYSVQQTTDGGYIITGTTYSFGAGYSDVYLIKTDANGNQTWYKTFGWMSCWEEGYSVQQDSYGRYIIAGYEHAIFSSSNVYLIMTDENGNQLWYKKFGGNKTDVGRSLQLTQDGGYIIAGYTESFGAGWEVYLIKIDNYANQHWYKNFGGSDYDEGYSVQQTTDGGYIITGYTESYSAGYKDVYLIKTDLTGDTLWTRTFGDSLNDCGYLVKQTLDGGYIITGYTESFGAGNSDVYLIKTDANGNVE